MIGHRVKHKSFGIGEIVETATAGGQLYITVYFSSGEIKRFLAPQAFDDGFVEFTNKKAMATLKKAVAAATVPVTNTATEPLRSPDHAETVETSEPDLWSETIDKLSDVLIQLRAEIADENLTIKETGVSNTDQHAKETVEALENAEALLVLALEYVDGMR